MREKIIAKPYFWFALILPSFISFISAILIYKDQNPVFCFKKKCLENFIELYSIPLQLLGLTLVLVGAAFTYYRIELSYKQNERQIYNSFRDEFLNLLESNSYKYKILDIPDISLFNKLYPNSKNGDQNLTADFEEFITYKDEMAHQGFTEAMNNLSDVLGTKNQYHAGAHQPLGNMFLWLRDIIPIDADLNLSYMAGDSFKGKYAKYIIDVSKDVLFIVSNVNVFEGWRFFDNRSKRNWRKNIDRLDNIIKECEYIDEFFANANNNQWVSTLMKRDYATFKTYNLQDVMPEAIINNIQAKEYIFESYTDKKGMGIITEAEAVELLKEKLNV